MSIGSKAACSAAGFFLVVAFTALTLSFSLSAFFYKAGMPAEPGDYVRMNLFISACIAVPTAIIASLHDHHMRLYQQRLEEMAWTDALTGLLNRRFFVHAAEEERARMVRSRESAALVLIDLDHFKEVNDLYGHSGGDIVLKQIAQIAHSELRGPFDRLGRWGGEEFVILLSAVNAEQAQLVCERLRRRIEETTIQIDDMDVAITASFGLCMLQPDIDLMAAIEAADEALYEAKRLGRNQVVCADMSEPGVSDRLRQLPVRKRLASQRDLKPAAVLSLPSRNAVEREALKKRAV